MTRSFAMVHADLFAESNLIINLMWASLTPARLTVPEPDEHKQHLRMTRDAAEKG